MAEVLSILILVGTIIFFGFFAEFLFNKLKVPDVLLLILFGFILGPYVTKLILPSSLISIAPIFTTFALLFLLFEGAFNIDLISFAKGISKGLMVTFYNFLLSVIAVTSVSMIFGFGLLQALLIGFVLGGISSAFVIPIIQKLKIKKETYSILTLESALTDVLCIVLAITVIQIITLNTFSFSFIFTKIATLFAVAGFLGVIAGIIWIVIVNKFLKNNKSYMITIAYLILLYAVTEYLNGNGAIAALFFGLVLRNSKKLTSLIKGKTTVSLTTPTERIFYSQISFFLKTFFFVYIGVLLDFSNITALIMGAVIAIALLLLRSTSSFFVKKVSVYDGKVVGSIFARGLAAAILAQLAVQAGIQNAEMISKIVFSVIMFTIILSSVKIFITDRNKWSYEKVKVY